MSIPSSWFAQQPPSRIHGPAHTARVMCWACVLAKDSPHLDAVIWAAACHDLRRLDDGPDPEHGKRAGQWVRQRLPQLVAEPPAQLELVASACDWHVCPDRESEWDHPALWLLKDADGLDRVRLQDLNPGLLRSARARSFADKAFELFQNTLPCRSADDVWRVALNGGMPIEPVLRWAERLQVLETPLPPPRIGTAGLLEQMTAEPKMAGLLQTPLGLDIYPDTDAPGLPMIEVLGAGWISDWQLAWLRERDWYGWDGPQVNKVYLAPLTRLDMPALLYHNTPAVNLESILSRGLLTGERAGRSTTRGVGAGRFIHVSLWTEGEEALPHRLVHDPVLLDGEWVKLRIDSSRIRGRLYRDPCSQVGGLLEVDCVSPEALEVVRRWLPDVPVKLQMVGAP